MPVEEYTVEHIMPQNENLSAAWRADLGPDWQRVHAEKLHTLGNLTLTGYNSEYSDRPFHEKRDMTGGFRESPLRLNAGLGALEVWNEAAINERAARLASQAVLVWAAPNLPPWSSEGGDPCPMGEGSGVLAGDSLPGHLGLLEGSQSFELLRWE